MGFLSVLANGLNTIIGVLVKTTVEVIGAIRDGLDSFRQRGGSVGSTMEKEVVTRKERLREINDESMHLRNKLMSRGNLNDEDRRRYHELREERDHLLVESAQAKEVKVAETILANEDKIEKVLIDQETTHKLQYNAFVDTLGKTCPKCNRSMKLQWRRDLKVPDPHDFFWGCTGWYITVGDHKACTWAEPLRSEDFGLMMDVSAPEFSLTSDEFGIILSDPFTQGIIDTRLKDLQSDLGSQRKGVELVTCPEHGAHMVLRRKTNPTGLLDAYFLACPYWKPNNQGCPFFEKLKSAPQLAALLKSETGRGVL